MIAPARLDPRLLGILLVFQTGHLFGQNPTYGTQLADSFVVKVHHARQAVAYSFQLADGNTVTRPPQPWILVQGAKVCIEVTNAHLLRYEYSLGALIDTTTPPDLIPPSILKDLASSFGLKNSAPGAGLTEASVAEQSPAWLTKYVSSLEAIHKELEEVKRVADASDSPEPVPGTDADGKGFRWARDSIARVDQSAGHVGSPTLQDELKKWRTTATNGAAAAGPQAPARSSFGKDKEGEAAYNASLATYHKASEEYSTWTQTVLAALDAYGQSIATSYQQLRTSFANTADAWSDCRVLGAHPTTLTLNIKAKKEGSVRVSRDKAVEVQLTPRYSWKALEVAPIATVVYTPGGHDFAVENGVVVDNPSATRLRAGTGLLVHLAGWGQQGDRDIALMLGADFLDGTSTTSGNLNLTMGSMVRLRDIIGLGVGMGFMQRDKNLKSGAVTGQPLPASFSTIRDAVNTTYQLSLVLMLRIKGYGI